MGHSITPMTMDHYDRLYRLWEDEPAITVVQADTRRGIAAFLDRNEGLCFTAHDDAMVVGGVLGGHDGRRGYLYHLAVDRGYRFRGIGRALVDKCLDGFRERGIGKIHLFAFKSNGNAIQFWRRTGFTLRDDIEILSMNLG